MSDESTEDKDGNTPKNWVKFDEEKNKNSENAGNSNAAVIDTESVQVSIDNSGRRTSEQLNTPVKDHPNINRSVSTPQYNASSPDVKISMSQLSAQTLHTIPLDENATNYEPNNVHGASSAPPTNRGIREGFGKFNLTFK